MVTFDINAAPENIGSPTFNVAVSYTRQRKGERPFAFQDQAGMPALGN
jgi:hypothetical protein